MHCEQDKFELSMTIDSIEKKLLQLTQYFKIQTKMYNDRNMNTNTMAWRTQNGQKTLTFNVAWQLGIAEA